MTARAFTIDVQRQFDAEVENLSERVLDFVFDALQGVVQITPVGNPALWSPASLPPRPGYQPGRAKNGWNVQVGGPGDITPGINDVDPTGAQPLTRGAQVLATLRGSSAFTVISIYNNVEYMTRLEGGYSTQAPTGIVGPTIATLEAGFSFGGSR